jgi:hypothetical protein
MFLESTIAAQVMDRLTRQRIVVLPIHDSFVVHPRHLDELEYAMCDAIADVLDVSRVTVTLESGFLERAYSPPGSVWAGPDDEAREWSEENERIYPWQVDQAEYSIFFDLWRAKGRDIGAEMERARRLLTQNAQLEPVSA